jgi:hypothetical protein
MHAGYFDVGQRNRRRRGHRHNHMPLLSTAEITNWLPEVSIPTDSLAVHFEFIVVRSDLTINKLVSDHINRVAFGQRRACPDHVQHQHRSFDKASFVIDGGAYR